MAIIPEYQRRQLASSVVGTPGVDNSGQQIGNSIAQNAGSIATAALSLAEQRQKAVDSAAAFNNSMTFEGDATKIADAHRKANQYSTEDPVVIADALKEKLNQQRNAVAETMGSDNAKALFLQKSGEFMNTAYKNELKSAGENQVVLASQKFGDSHNIIVGGVYDTFKSSTMTYDEKIAALQDAEKNRLDNIKLLAPIAGPKEAFKKNIETAQGMAKAATLGLMENDPVNGLKFLKDENVKKVLGPEEHAKLLNDMQKRALNFDDIMKQRQFEVVAQTNSSEIEKFYNGQQDLASIANIKDPKTREFLTDAYLSTHQLTAGEIVAKESDFVKRWEDMFVHDKKGNITKELLPDVKPEDVANLQYEAMKNYKITKNNSSLIRLSKEMPDLVLASIKNGQPGPKLKVIVDALNNFGPIGKSLASRISPHPSGVDSIAAAQKTEMLGNFFDVIGRIDTENPDAVSKAIKAVIKLQQNKVNPNRTKYQIGQTVPTPGGAGVVVDYADDGEPILLRKK